MAKKVKKSSPDIIQKKDDVAKVNTSPVGRNVYLLYSFRTQAILLAVIGFIFYCNTFGNEAAFDDRMAITDNEYVQKGMAGIPDILTKDSYQSYLEHKNGSNQLAGGRYRPLSLITFAIEQQLMGTDHDSETAQARESRIAHEMHARHVVNVLLYILSVVVLLYFLHRIVFPDEPPLLALVAALLFTIHPIHSEVVANVKSRDEILSVLFILLTLIKAFRYKETLKKSDLILAMLYFFLAMLSKEYAVTLIILLPLAFYLFKNEPAGYSIRTTLPYLTPLIVYFLLHISAVTAAAEGAEHNVLNNPYLFATPVQKIATEIMVLLDYLKLLIYPNPLIADYSYNQVPYTDFSNAAVWLSLAIHLSLIVAMLLCFKKRHVLGFAIAFYLVNLALVSNLFFNIGAPMAERLVYHSSVGFCIAVAWLIYMGFSRLKSPANIRPALIGLMALLVIVSGFKTIDRNGDWKNDETLFLTDVKNAPNSVLINNDAAAACMSEARKHKDDVAMRDDWFKKAIAYFDHSLAIYKKQPTVYLNRGLCNYNMGNPEKALDDWKEVSKYNPNEQNLSKYIDIAGRYFFAKGMRLKAANQLDSARVAFLVASSIAPKSVDVLFELANICFLTGQYCGAKDALDKILAIDPNNVKARQLYEQVNVKWPHPCI